MFIGLVVVVVAAVAMVAVGRGDGLAPAVPDRPDVELPRDRPLQAHDLAHLRLSVAVRGYRMDEVDALLARLGAEIEDRDAHGQPRPPVRAAGPPVEPSALPSVQPSTQPSTQPSAQPSTQPHPEAVPPTPGSAPGATAASDRTQERL